MDKNELVAAIDLGTNSSRLLIADYHGWPVYRDVRHVALGEGLAENGCFSEHSMARALNSFIDFKNMLDEHKVKRYRAIATAACRMSSNAKEFVAKVKEKSGIDLEIISEFEEARLTLLGAKLNAPKDKKYLFVYDLGGGSTELSLATNSDNPEIIATVSIPLGARNASEIFGLVDYDKKAADELILAVRKYLVSFMEQIKNIDYPDNTALIATSSTPLRLAAFIKSHPVYDKFAADGVMVSINELDKAIDRILKFSAEERAASPYIGRNRAGIFVAALIIFREIYRELKCVSMIASLKGAQEAIVSSFFKGENLSV